MNFNQEKPRTTDNTMISDLKRHELILTSIAHSITEVEPFVDTICSELEVQEELFGNILVALTEAVNNAIHHGNELDPVKKVHVQARVDGRILTFIIRDQGPGFDYNNLPDPGLLMTDSWFYPGIYFWIYRRIYRRIYQSAAPRASRVKIRQHMHILRPLFFFHRSI